MPCGHHMSIYIDLEQHLRPVLVILRKFTWLTWHGREKNAADFPFLFCGICHETQSVSTNNNIQILLLSVDSYFIITQTPITIHEPKFSQFRFRQVIMAEIESRATEVLNTSRHASLATPQTPRQDETAPPFGKNKHTSKRPLLSFCFSTGRIFCCAFHGPWTSSLPG